MLTSSLRWARTKPRFQFGSHCAVTLARAVMMIPIRTVAARASMRVNPATALRL